MVWLYKCKLKFESYSFIAMICLVTFNSCSIFKRAEKGQSKEKEKQISLSEKNISKAIAEARKYMGTPYKSGGNDKQGIDCSGLVKIAFDHTSVILPRTTKEQYQFGKFVELQEAKKGDLIFFNTSKKKNGEVNHVGIITSVNPEIVFIHASSSKGVMENKLSEPYYQKSFVNLVRIIND